MWNVVKKVALPVVAAAMLGACAERETIVTIDDESITMAQLHEKLVQQYGMETLDQLVSNKVIELEAKKQQIEVSEEAIEAEYADYIAMYGSEEALIEYLETYKMTPEDVRYDLEIYLLTTALMEDYVAITETDVEAYFEDNKTSFKEGAALEDVQDGVYAALLEERVNEQYGTWIDEKYEEYDIKTTFFEQSE